MKKSILIASVSLITVSLSCKKTVEDMPQTDDGTVVLDLPAKVAEYYDPKTHVTNFQNEKATLGRVLFYDTRLSLNNAVACASCHKQEYAFTDNARFSRGFDNRLTGRNSMTIEGLALFINKRSVHDFHPNGSISSVLFWDGRENDLKNLIARPITNHVEMGVEDPKMLEKKLAGVDYYKKLFRAAYGHEVITFDRIAESMALFVASIRSNNSKFDQAKTRKQELTAQESFGLHLFQTKYPCLSCHKMDTIISGYQSGIPGTPLGAALEDIGLDEVPTDKGRGNISTAEYGKFKVPTLKNIALTAPYMHDGRFNTLEEVIDHYSKDIKNSQNLAGLLKDVDGKAKNMHITEEEKAALVAFLKTLTDYDLITDPKFSNPFKVQ